MQRQVCTGLPQQHQLGWLSVSGADDPAGAVGPAGAGGAASADPGSRSANAQWTAECSLRAASSGSQQQCLFVNVLCGIHISMPDFDACFRKITFIKTIILYHGKSQHGEITQSYVELWSDFTD